MSLTAVHPLITAVQETFPRPAVCHTDPGRKLHIWVKLLHRLNPFCHQEALLLCQTSETTWLAWVPDHGEATLCLGQFCVNEDDFLA